MSNFHQASNFVIKNLNQTDIRVDLEQQKQNAFALLLSEIVQGASHSAGERYDAPKCHPDTRKAVLEHIKSWVDNDNESTSIMWLNGPAGAGKSAIAQTTAEDCHNERKLAASFFFSRFVAGRNTKNSLIATIAYQLSVSIPEIKDHIVNSIAKNPNIFRENIKSQFQTLVVEPYCLFNQAERDNTRPRLIIIDGLDECNDANHQAEIISALSSSLPKDISSGLRVLISSRPETRIHRTFDDEVISTICTRVTLDDKYNPDQDIELFLRSSFQVLKRHHVLAPMLQSWPPEQSVKRIVKKSSGQFIYTATVVKYISDSQQNPVNRLDIVLNIKDAGGEQPFSQLDALYTTILSNICRDYKKVALIFEAIMYTRYIKDLSASFVDEFLHLENETPLILADLSSIVNTTMKIGLRFFHASFSDYLNDPSRSQEFYIDKHQSHVHLAICCSNRIAGPPGSEIVSEYSIRAIFDHYMLSNFDDNVLESIISNGLLAVDGVNSFHRKWYSNLDNHYNTFLCTLIYFNDNREKTKDSLRNAIDSAFRNHLQNYDPHQILIIYYFAPWFKRDALDPLQLLVPVLKDKTSKHNILSDISYPFVMKWFILIIQDDLVHFSQDAHIKSACYILEVLLGTALRHNCHISEEARKACNDLHSGINSITKLHTFLQFASDFLANLPDTIEVSTAIFQKWRSINPTSEQLAKASDVTKFRYRMLYYIIQEYFKQTLKHDVVGGQTDTNEHLSTTAENLRKDISTTGHYTPLNKLLVLLISVQFLLIAYMYMHFNGISRSSSSM